MIIFTTMTDIIQVIERFRIEKRIKKEQLTKHCGLNKNTYANYLGGAKVPYNVVKEMLAYMGKQIIIADKI